MKRQGLKVSPNEIRELADELEREIRQMNLEFIQARLDFDTKIQINIINKTPECSDTWEIENTQTTSIKIRKRQLRRKENDF